MIAVNDECVGHVFCLPCIYLLIIDPTPPTPVNFSSLGTNLTNWYKWWAQRARTTIKSSVFPWQW